MLDDWRYREKTAIHLEVMETESRPTVKSLNNIYIILLILKSYEDGTFNGLRGREIIHGTQEISEEIVSNIFKASLTTLLRILFLIPVGYNLEIWLFLWWMARTCHVECQRSRIIIHGALIAGWQAPIVNSLFIFKLVERKQGRRRYSVLLDEGFGVPPGKWTKATGITDGQAIPYACYPWCTSTDWRPQFGSFTNEMETQKVVRKWVSLQDTVNVVDYAWNKIDQLERRRD